MKSLILKIVIVFNLLFGILAASAQPINRESLLNELQLLQKQLVPDKRIAILDVELRDAIPTGYILSGTTNLPEAKKQIVDFFHQKSLTVHDSIRLIPDIAVGETIWGLITLSVANLRAQPDDASELVSQAVMGTPVKLLDYQKNWYRIQTPEGYLGWMDSKELKTYTKTELEHWKLSKRFLFNKTSGYAYSEPVKKGQVVSDLVLNSLFEVTEIKKGFLKISLPDKRIGYVKKTDCISFEEWINQKPSAQALLAIAKQLMGHPYLWGGTSSKGIDCSGFVKVVFYSQGIILARDASQQARYGKEIDFYNASNLNAGDLLFFGRSPQRINHVGISMGESDFIHSSGRVHVSSIDPKDSKYVSTRTCVAARRVLGSLDTDGITQVKNHPWYLEKP